MPRVTRRRRIAVSVGEVWDLVSDPYNLPRWWPRTSRVENVDLKPGGRRSRWTQVLQTSEGRGVRADFRCVSAAEGERWVWEQEIEGTPFERHLKASSVTVALRPGDGGTEVSLTSAQTLRGMSRLGGPMMRGGQGKILDEALNGLERALT
jgi:uncharacterized protein YndB with AHSA1/START domain